VRAFIEWFIVVAPVLLLAAFAGLVLLVG